jgi:hypothetical protein
MPAIPSTEAVMRMSRTLGLCCLLIACNKPAAEPAASAESEPGAPAAPAPAAEAPTAVPAAAPAAPAAAPTGHEGHPTAEVAQGLPLPAVPAGAKVTFLAPKDGEKITGPLENGKVAVKVQMGAENIAIKPAGPVEAGSGHHHVLIDADAMPAGTVVPKDETHLHFGQGQTEASIAVSPGEHTLTLQLADGIHRSYGPQLAASIKVNVVPAGSVGSEPKLGTPVEEKK